MITTTNIIFVIINWSLTFVVLLLCFIPPSRPRQTSARRSAGRSERESDIHIYIYIYLYIYPFIHVHIHICTYTLYIYIYNNNYTYCHFCQHRKLVVLEPAVLNETHDCPSGFQPSWTLRFACISLSLYMYMYLSLYVYIYISLYIYIYICILVSLSLSTYIYIYTHIHIHTNSATIHQTLDPNPWTFMGGHVARPH